jgi:hypothetical protein
MISPDSLGTACPLSGRNSTYRPVQILEAGSGAQAKPPPAGVVTPGLDTTIVSVDVSVPPCPSETVYLKVYTLRSSRHYLATKALSGHNG